MNLGNLLKKCHDFAGAYEAYKAAITRKPTYAFAHNNMGNLLKDWGRPAEAEVYYR